MPEIYVPHNRFVFVKRIFFGLVVFLCLGGIVFFLYQPISCGFPKYYYIGNIDPRFNISEIDLKNVLVKAEDVWEKPFDKNIFMFDEGKGVPINLIYDERQEQNVIHDTLDISLKDLQQKQEDIKTERNNLSIVYESKNAKYELLVADYEQKISKFNSDVEYWNAKQNIPNDIRQKIEKEKNNLAVLRDKIEKSRIDLNKTISELNNLNETEGQIIKEYNKKVASFNDRFGEEESFQQANFTGDSINVFEFENEDSLKVALAHELGHYIGISHVINSKSLMHYLLSDQDIKNTKLTNEDKEAFLGICGPDQERVFGRILQYIF